MILSQVQHQQHQVLWVEVIPAPRFAPATRLNQIWSRLRILLQAAQRADLFCFVSGCRRTAWLMPELDRLVQDKVMHFSTHRWCHFGIKISPNSLEPSSVCLRMLSSHKITNHSCKCAPGTEHVFDLDCTAPTRARLRARAEHDMMISLMSALGMTQGSEMPIDSKESQDKTAHTENQQQAKAFPTEQKLAQKKRKQAGDTTTSRRHAKNVEQHFDDCGESLSSLDIPPLSLADIGAEPEDEMYRSQNGSQVDKEEVSIQTVLSHLVRSGGYGSSYTATPNPTGPHMKARNLEEALAVMSQMPAAGPLLDVIELCGGEGLTTFMCHKRKLKTGANFELITGIDLTNPEAQDLVRKYLGFTRPLVVVMGPICAPFGPLGSRNRVLHHESWQRSYSIAAPLARFCGEIAWTQMSQGRHFIQEQPFPSKLYEEDPWPAIRNDPRCLRVVFDQCQVGQRVRGLPAKKPTELVASHVLLLKRFANRICQNDHEHIALVGGAAHEAQRWPPLMCQMIAQSIQDLSNEVKQTNHSSRDGSRASYPTVSTSTREEDDAFDPASGSTDQPWWRKCKGCLWRLHKHSPTHTRVQGECKYPDTEPLDLGCPACRADKPRSHPQHTLDHDCRHALTSAREGTIRSVRERKAPRASRIPTHEDPTASLREETADRRMEDDLVPDCNDDTGADESDYEPSIRPDESSIVPSARRGRGPDLGPREDRLKLAEADTQTPELTEWTKFDLQSSLRALHFGTRAQRLRLLRKLHLRWWHVGSTTMTRLMKAAGAPSEVIELIPGVIDSCRICRAWSKPHNTIASNRLVTAFNSEVECDIVFIRHHGQQMSFLHCVDRAVKWCSTCVVEDKSTETLLDALDTCWVSIFGAMKVLIVDGELGFDNEAATWYFQIRGIEKRTAAVGQHTRIADRRVQILRDCIHKISQQLSEEGIPVPFKRILAEATFVINAVSSAGGVSPYVAVLGRAPALLPELGPNGIVNDDRDPECPIQGSARLRELAVATITESSARERLRTAMRTPTRPTGEELEFKVGDTVEYYRPPAHKDLSGWRGPATVTDLTRLEHGRIGLRTSTDLAITCRVQDVRHRLVYLAELEAPLSSHAGKAQAYLQEALENISQGAVFTLGQVPTNNGDFVESAHTPQRRMVLQAALFVGEVIFQLQTVAAIRIAKGVKTLSAKQSYSHSVVIWWLTPGDRVIRYHETDDIHIQTDHMVGENWQQARIVQFLCVAPSAACTQQAWRMPLDDGPTSPTAPSVHTPSNERLSTIPEGSHESEGNETQAREIAVSLFGIEAVNDPERGRFLIEAAQWCQDTTDEEAPKENALIIPEWSQVQAQLPEYDELKIFAETLGEEFIPNMTLEHEFEYLDSDETGVYVAIDLPWPFSKLAEGLEREPLPDETVEIRCYQTHCRKTVIERNDDLLTMEEMKEHASECLAAMTDELRTWSDLRCFERAPRQGAANILDTKWVFKWKYVKGERRIRARLTLRGFREEKTGDEVNFSATATKFSQRLLVSEAVQRSWCIASTDISKAFLQGITYKELSSQTGAPERQVHFELCNRAAPLLEQIPGFQNFDPTRELLLCLKPGTGCRDAPRAFSMRLRKVTDQYGLKSALIDSELEMLWEGDQLKLIILKHVDDIKIAGEEHIIKDFVDHLSKTFGKLDIHWHKFVFCGIQHTQDPVTKEVTLDQNAFVNVIKPMSQPEVQSMPGMEKLPEQLRRHFLSLLMTIAYAVQSRPDIAVFIAALQKECSAATFDAARRLNKVLLWTQKHPSHVRYRKLDPPPDTLALISDSAFKAREQDGLSMRGLMCIRVNQRKLENGGQVECHLLHTVSKTQRHVTRSTFASELFAANDSVDTGLIQIVSLEELKTGPMTWDKLQGIREGPASLQTNLDLVVDAKSVTAAAISPILRAPAESSALVAVAWLRERMQRKDLTHLYWCDTRCMAADGLTKGSIRRDAIQSIMNGIWRINPRLEEQKLRV